MLEIHTLSVALGAEATGIDFGQQLLERDVERLHAAFLEHHLLCLRAEPLPAADLLRLARHFGELQLQLLRRGRHAQVPEVSILDSTYRTPQAKPADLLQRRVASWHTDDSYFEIPAKATMFQALEIPQSGGETRFCNTEMAYDELPPELLRRLEGLHAVHGYDTSRAPARAVKRTDVEIEETPEVVHPLIRTHEETGKKAIYFNSNRTDRVLRLNRDESDALLDQLHAHMIQPHFQYSHTWRVGDILLWDNRCLTHSVNVDYPPCQPRIHHRILLRGTRPV
ncbi:MAG: TauD/TfdA family dioxygenase [Pseudomonadales bacterium]|nr:TauD/TfdA family dioxygenase [Gammaproteobacteria bacterium]